MSDLLLTALKRDGWKVIDKSSYLGADYPCYYYKIQKGSIEKDIMIRHGQDEDDNNTWEQIFELSNLEKINHEQQI